MDSVDYSVRRLLVVQMGDDPEVFKVLQECQQLLPNLIVVSGLGNLGCAAGRNRVILEDLNADYWFILGSVSVWARARARVGDANNILALLTLPSPLTLPHSSSPHTRPLAAPSYSDLTFQSRRVFSAVSTMRPPPSSLVNPGLV